MGRYCFNDIDRVAWLKRITHIVEEDADELNLCFLGLPSAQMEPEHIVSLACLIESFAKKNRRVTLDKSEVGQYLFSILRFQEYWGGHKDYVDADDSNLLNLWRVDKRYADLHAKRIVNYLKHLKKNLDFDGVGSSIAESYYNVFDHASADGNVFFFAKYNPVNEVLRVAVCDFGIGVASSVKSKAPSLGDCAALKKAIEPGFTIGSQKHNKGWGLDNIRTGSSSMHIISNSARLAVSDDNIEHVIPLDFNFKGTLLSYSVKLSQLEMEENVVDFEW